MSKHRDELGDILKGLADYLDERPLKAPLAKSFDGDLAKRLCADYRRAMRMKDEAEALLEELMETAQRAHESAWRECLEPFEDQWVEVVAGEHKGALGWVCEVDLKRGEVLVQLLRDGLSEWVHPKNRGLHAHPWAFLVEDLSLEVDENRLTVEIAECETIRAAAEANAPGPCPATPCAHCGHRYCFSYHFYETGSPADWELRCCSKTCNCHHCTRARADQTIYHRFECCQCANLSKCRCGDCVAWRSRPSETPDFIPGRVRE